MTILHAIGAERPASPATSLIARATATLLGAGVTALIIVAALDGATRSLVI